MEGGEVLSGRVFFCQKNPFNEIAGEIHRPQGLPPLQLTGVTFDKVVKNDDTQRVWEPRGCDVKRYEGSQGVMTFFTIFFVEPCRKVVFFCVDWLDECEELAKTSFNL